MVNTKTDILVYAHWLGMKEPKLIGVLSAQHTKTECINHKRPVRYHSTYSTKIHVHGFVLSWTK